MNNNQKLGSALIFLGFIMALTGKVITGSVIGLQGQNYLGTLGILVFIIGAFLMIVSKIGGLEKDLGGEVQVYDSDPYKKSNLSEDERLYIRDSPKGLFSEGDINLRDFKALYDEIKGDNELREWAKNFYGPRLLSIVQEGKMEDNRAASEFLKIFYEGKLPKVIMKREEGVEEGSVLNLAAKYLSQNRIPDNSNDYISVAHDMGYISEGGRREGTIIRKGNKGDIVTVVPGPGHITRGTGRNILKALSTGESNFRQDQRRNAEKRRAEKKKDRKAA
jgi:hypothetical protein